MMYRDEPAASTVLPVIPSKRYFTISEVSTLCDVKPHVLRYWEQEFSVLRPSKRRGNRRYYRREDVLIVSQIKKLLYEQGYTISGARAQLTSHRLQAFQDIPEIEPSEPLVEPRSNEGLATHAELIKNLQDVLKILS